jgi:endonuclease YncB( thermonuclease family)
MKKISVEHSIVYNYSERFMGILCCKPTVTTVITKPQTVHLSELKLDDIEETSLIGQWFQCRVKRVYDGDTVTIVFFDPFSGRPVQDNIRLVGIDTPEINVKSQHTDAIQARNYLINILKDQTNVVCNVTGKDKYRRLLGNLYPCREISAAQDVLSVSELMLQAAEKGLIKCNRYDGKTKAAFKAVAAS